MSWGVTLLMLFETSLNPESSSTIVVLTDVAIQRLVLRFLVAGQLVFKIGRMVFIIGRFGRCTTCIVRRGSGVGYIPSVGKDERDRRRSTLRQHQGV